jgi:hypothetical protein
MVERRFLVITPDQVRVGIDQQRDVVAEILAPEQDTGLLGIGLVLRMTPAEARSVAALLSKKADEAEAGLPRA